MYVLVLYVQVNDKNRIEAIHQVRLLRTCDLQYFQIKAFVGPTLTHG